MPVYDISQSKYSEPVVWDYLTFGFGALVYVLLFAVNCLAFTQRHFPPIKAKQLWTVWAMYFASICWWFSVAVMNIVIPRTPFLGSCSFWGIWAQCFFGIHLFTAILIFRYYRIYRILCQKKAFWKYPSIVLAIIMIPVLIVCAILQGLSLAGLDDEPTEMCCSIEIEAEIGLIAIFALYFVFIIFFFVRLRKAAGGYREFTENFQILICFAVLIVFYLAFELSDATDYIWGRCLQNLLISITIIVTYCFILAKPLYGSIFHPEQTLLSFRESMQLNNFSSDVKQSTDIHRAKSELSISEVVKTEV